MYPVHPCLEKMEAGDTLIYRGYSKEHRFIGISVGNGRIELFNAIYGESLSKNKFNPAYLIRIIKAPQCTPV